MLKVNTRQIQNYDSASDAKIVGYTHVFFMNGRQQQEFMTIEEIERYRKRNDISIDLPIYYLFKTMIDNFNKTRIKGKKEPKRTLISVYKAYEAVLFVKC